jgi:hypothetical protein
MRRSFSFQVSPVVGMIYSVAMLVALIVSVSVNGVASGIAGAAMVILALALLATSWAERRKRAGAGQRMKPRD